MAVIRFNRRRPVAILVMAATYALVALATWIEAVGSDPGFTRHDALVGGLYLAVAYGLLRMRPWGWYLLLAHAAFLLALHSVYAATGTGIDRWLFIQLNVVVLFVIWFVARRSVRSPFHDPAMRWWERQHPRHGVTFVAGYTPAVAPDETPRDYQARGINLSAGGCYVALPDDQSLSQGQALTLTLSYRAHEPLVVEGRVAWISGGPQATPAGAHRGAGVRFARMNAAQRRLLAEILAAALADPAESGNS